MAEFVPAVGNILALIERQDWERLRLALAPEVHWITAVEEHLHGPEDVVAQVSLDGVPGPPAFHEVDVDGRLVLWVDKMG